VKPVQPILLASVSGVAIVPVAVEHAAMLAALVRQDRERLDAFLPMVATLSTLDTARAHMERAAVRASEGEIFEWHLFMGDALCGSVRVKDIDHDDRKASIGYFVGSRFSGKGIVSSALRAVLEWCFDTLGLNRVELRCATSNAPSIRVAERLGFVREGLLRQDECLHGAFVDHYVYGLLKAEFRRGTTDGCSRT
jgi:ribosomal-protein-serine acetyltransferase